MATPPIIVNEKGDVSLYETVEDAEVALEPIDIENEEYAIFDSEGLVMVPRVANDQIHVELSDSSPRQVEPEQLQTALRRFLSQLDQELTGVTEDEIWRSRLPELIATLRVVQGRPPRSRLRLWPWRRS
jgi:hypothetical protein